VGVREHGGPPPPPPRPPDGFDGENAGVIELNTVSQMYADGVTASTREKQACQDLSGDTSKIYSRMASSRNKIPLSDCNCEP
jgi:hypothetical protein